MKKMRYIQLVALLLLTTHLSTTPAWAQAQCGIENSAFQAGEKLDYDLHFNWKFVWLKVGSATMQTTSSTYEGEPVYKTSLITRGNSKLDNVFMMRDTLLSLCSKKDLSPLYFRKGAREGKRYYVDELWYTYPRGNCHLKMHRITDEGEHKWQEKEYASCIYDMMSIFMRARNFDASNMKKGDIVPLPISDAKSLSNSWLEYRGKENFKVSGTKEKFRCIVFSFYEHENGKSHELVRFFVTDDENHIPVRLDMFLSFGSAKAFLRTYEGVRSEMTSKIN
jgi:hypothetical protein